MQIDQPSYAAVQSELMPGETVLWAGQPDTSIIFHREDLYLIPFSLLWGGFAIFWEAGVAGYWGSGSKLPHEPWAFGLVFGAVFVVMGQYFIWGRFLVTVWKKRRTYYAVTNRRLVVVQNGFTRKMASAFIDSLPVLIKENAHRGVGSLLFSPPLPVWSRNRGFGAWDGMNIGDVPEFRDIHDVDGVYRMISDLREKTRHVTQTV